MEEPITIYITREQFRKMIKESITDALTEQKLLSPANSGLVYDKPLTIDEASIFLSLAKQTLYGYTSKKLIPFIKRGKKIYFEKHELIKWLNQGKYKSIDQIIKEAEDYED